MSETQKDGGDNKTDIIDPGDDDKNKNKAPTEVVQARTPEPITNRPRENKPRTVGNLHTPSNMNRYRRVGSPGHSVRQVRGMFVPWSREADYDRRDLPLEFPRQRLAPISPNQTNATRTISRDLDLYEPPRYNVVRQEYVYDHPGDIYPYFSFPPDDGKRRYRRLIPPRERIVPEGKWSVVSNAGSRKKRKPPPRRAASDPGKIETAMWVHRHGRPTEPGLWPYRIVHDRELDRDFLEDPLGKRLYIGHVPGVTDRDRWERQYWDYLNQREIDSDVLDERRRHRGYYNSHTPILDTSDWIRKHYGVHPDYTDHYSWHEREKEILRQRERERYFGGKRDHLLTRGTLLALEGSVIGPDWYMTESERRKFLHEQDIARRRAYKDRVRHRDSDSDFTSVSQRAERMEKLRRGWWTPLNVRDDESRYTEYKPNWQVNDNWKHKRPRADPRYANVSRWLADH